MGAEYCIAHCDYCEVELGNALYDNSGKTFCDQNCLFEHCEATQEPTVATENRVCEQCDSLIPKNYDCFVHEGGYYCDLFCIVNRRLS